MEDFELNCIPAPDLADLFVPVVANYILNMTFRGPGPANRIVRSYLTNFIRVTDRGIREYQRGRQGLEDYVADNNRLVRLLEGLSDFEACLASTRRSLRFFEGLRTHREGPTVERITAQLINSYGKRLVQVRDAVEHMDERIRCGELAEGEPIALALSEDKKELVVGSNRLSFGDLSEILRRLHAVSLALADTRTAFSSEHLFGAEGQPSEP